MTQHLVLIGLVVRDYDEAIDFYTRKLGFLLKEDTVLSETKRWVVVSPPVSAPTPGTCSILLAKAANEHQTNHIGNQTGGRVFLFLHTDDFWKDYHRLQEQNIHFVPEPIKEVYGTVAVFEDLYGNFWDLIQPS